MATDPWGFLETSDSSPPGQPPPSPGSGYYFQKPRPQDYIYPDPRPLNQIGKPDYYTNQIRAAPVSLPGPMVPQPSQFPQLYARALSGAPWSGATNGYARNALMAGGKYQKDYIEGQIAGQRYNQAQFAFNAEKFEWEQSLELQKYWDLFNGYADNPDKQKEMMREYAQQRNDEPMLNILKYGSADQIENLLTQRDIHWITLSRANAQAAKESETAQTIKQEEAPDETPPAQSGQPQSFQPQPSQPDTADDQLTTYDQYQQAQAAKQQAAPAASGAPQGAAPRGAVPPGPTAPPQRGVAANVPSSAGVSPDASGLNAYDQVTPQEGSEADRMLGPTPAPITSVQVPPGYAAPQAPSTVFFGGGPGRDQNAQQNASNLLRSQAINYLLTGKDELSPKDPLLAQRADAIHKYAARIDDYINKLMSSNLSGAQILAAVNQVDPVLANQVWGQNAGRVMGSQRGTSRYWQLVNALVARTGGDATLFDRRRKIQDDYAPGGYAGRWTAQTANLARATQNVVLAARDLPAGAPLANIFRERTANWVTGNAAYRKFAIAWGDFAGIYVRMNRRGTGAESDIERQIENTLPSSTKEQIAGALQIDTKDALETYEGNKRFWANQMGGPMPWSDPRAEWLLTNGIQDLDPHTLNYMGPGQDPFGDSLQSHWTSDEWKRYQWANQHQDSPTATAIYQRLGILPHGPAPEQ